MKTIQIDMDGVTIDSPSSGLKRLIPEFEEWRFKTYSYNADLQFSQKAKDEKNIVQPDISTDILEKINQAFQNPNYLNEEDLYPNLLEEISDVCQNFKVIQRSLSRNTEVKEKKELLLAPLMKIPNFYFESVLLTTSLTKEPIDCDYYIDDYMGNLEKYFDRNTKLFLINAPYNQENWNRQFDYTKVTRVKNLSEALFLIKKEEGLC